MIALLRARKQALITVAAVLLLALLAIGLSRLTFAPARPLAFDALGFGGGPAAAEQGIDIRRVFVVLIWVALAVVGVGIILLPDLRAHLLRRLPVWAVWFLLLYLLLPNIRSCANVGGAATRNTPDDAPNAPTAQLTPTARLVPPEFVANPPPWLVIGVSLALGLALAAALFFIVRRILGLRRAARAVAAPPDELAAIAGEAQRALETLQAGGDLRETILRCYDDMVRVLSERPGVSREFSMTAREFEVRLAALGIADQPIRRLTRLFETVRYSQRAPGPPEVQEAEWCLSAISARYAKRSDDAT